MHSRLAWVLTKGFLVVAVASLLLAPWTSRAADPPEPELVYPPLAENPAYMLSGQVASDGKSFVVVQGYPFVRETGKTDPAQLKVINLATKKVASTFTLDTDRAPSLTPDGRHGIENIDGGELVVYSTADGKVARRMAFDMPGAEKPSLQPHFSEDLSFFIAAGRHSTSYVLARFAGQPLSIHAKLENRWEWASTLDMIGDVEDGRIAAIMIPKKHQKEAWKLRLTDMQFRVLSEIDVPPMTAISDMHGGKYPMLLTRRGPYWMLLSLDHDKPVVARTGTQQHGKEEMQRVAKAYGGIARNGTQRPQANPTTGIIDGVISPDGQWLVTIAIIGPGAMFSTGPEQVSHLSVWSVPSGQRVQTLPFQGAAGGLRFDASGRHLSHNVVQGTSARLYVWNFASLVATQ